jgi:hypothetical protein
METNLLDDNSEWENDEQNDAQMFYTNNESEVVMIRTFNTEDQAYLYAARLKDNDIDAHVVSSATSQMTPFAYGNIRLYVAEAHALGAKQILTEMDALNDIYEQPNLSATRIFIIIFMGLLIMSIIIAAIQTLFFGDPRLN